MILFRQAASLHFYLEKQRTNRNLIGFIPTMGALHAGHESLITAAKENSDITVCSIFINPTQFNNAVDFEKYPVTISEDILKLESIDCDVLFLPSVNEIYPNGTTATTHYDLDYTELVLEGKYRPGHFQGVCQVVHRLLEIVQPHKLFLGQKDYQQSLIIKKLIAQLQMQINAIICPTLREKGGLAMSSRNLRLSLPQLQNAAAIYEALTRIQNGLATGLPQQLEEHATEYLLQHGFDKVDYVSITDAKTLLPVTQWNGNDPLVILAAAFIGEVRLIDNFFVDTTPLAAHSQPILN